MAELGPRAAKAKLAPRPEFGRNSISDRAGGPLPSAERRGSPVIPSVPVPVPLRDKKGRTASQALLDRQGQ